MAQTAITGTPAATKGAVTLLIATRKGAFTLRCDASRRTWKLSAPMFLGHIVHHMVLDPRDRTHHADGRQHGPSGANDLPFD